MRKKHSRPLSNETQTFTKKNARAECKYLNCCLFCAVSVRKRQHFTVHLFHLYASTQAGPTNPIPADQKIDFQQSIAYVKYGRKNAENRRTIHIHIFLQCRRGVKHSRFNYFVYSAHSIPICLA